MRHLRLITIQRPELASAVDVFRILAAIFTALAGLLTALAPVMNKSSS